VAGDAAGGSARHTGADVARLGGWAADSPAGAGEAAAGQGGWWGGHSGMVWACVDGAKTGGASPRGGGRGESKVCYFFFGASQTRFAKEKETRAPPPFFFSRGEVKYTHSGPCAHTTRTPLSAMAAIGGDTIVREQREKRERTTLPVSRRIKSLLSSSLSSLTVRRSPRPHLRLPRPPAGGGSGRRGGR